MYYGFPCKPSDLVGDHDVFVWAANQNSHDLCSAGHPRIIMGPCRILNALWYLISHNSNILLYAATWEASKPLTHRVEAVENLERGIAQQPHFHHASCSPGFSDSVYDCEQYRNASWFRWPGCFFRTCEAAIYDARTLQRGCSLHWEYRRCNPGQPGWRWDTHSALGGGWS